jgi:DNA invertase Pin-like site-specific DNA recombinase
VSTERQGKSGLGLEAQKASVGAFIAARNGGARLLASYIEVESGKCDDNRPKLMQAMKRARLTNSVLLIAKLDRLSRDAHFLLGLQKAGVRFTACDMPEANEMVVALMAIIAEAERKMISDRTKAALQAAKARGVKLGNPRGAAHLRQFGNAAAAAAVHRRAEERAAGLASTVEAIRAEGITSANGIAAALNAREIATPRGGKWTARAVLNVTARLASA